MKFQKIIILSHYCTTTPTTTYQELNFVDTNVTVSRTLETDIDIENEQMKHAMAVATATTVPAHAAMAAIAAVILLTSAANGTSKSIEEAAAIKIQSSFRSHLVFHFLRNRVLSLRINAVGI